jgi:hypothetical protein
MKKDLKYFETEIKRITEEFEDYKKKLIDQIEKG